MAYYVRQNFLTEGVSPGLFTLVSGTNCVSQDEDGLLIDSKSFNTIIDLEPHHHTDSDKFVVSINPKISVSSIPPGEEMKFEVTMSSKQFFRQPNATLPIVPSVFINRIRNIYEDPRLCCSSVGVYDPETLLAFKFLITDNMIYAYYGRERTKVEIHAEKPLAAFISLVPLQKRGVVDIDDPLSKLRMFHRLTIGVHMTTHREIVVVWYINGDKKFSINTPGHRISDQYQVLDQGGVSQTINIQELVMQLGHHSFLDFQLPNNYSRDKIITVTHGGFPVHRSCSGLVQLMDSKMYKEIFPDFFGNNVDIDASKSFAVPFETAAANISNRVFGQGMISRLRELTIGLSRRSSRGPGGPGGIDGPPRALEAPQYYQGPPAPRLPPVREEFKPPQREFQFNVIQQEPPKPMGRTRPPEPDYIDINVKISPKDLKGPVRDLKKRPNQQDHQHRQNPRVNRVFGANRDSRDERDPFMAISSDVKKDSDSSSSESSGESKDVGVSDSLDLFPQKRESEEEESLDKRKPVYNRSQNRDDPSASEESLDDERPQAPPNPSVKYERSIGVRTYDHPPFNYDDSYSQSSYFEEEQDEVKPVYTKEPLKINLDPHSAPRPEPRKSESDRPFVELNPQSAETHHTPTASPTTNPTPPGVSPGGPGGPVSLTRTPNNPTPSHTPTEPKENRSPSDISPNKPPSLETPNGHNRPDGPPSLESINRPPSLETPKHIHSHSIGDEVPSYSQKRVTKVQIPLIVSDYNSPPSLESVDVPDKGFKVSGISTISGANIRICWWCRKSCGGTCCSGQCGSEHCISYRNLSGRKYTRKQILG